MTQKMLLLFSALVLIGGVVAQAQKIDTECFPSEMQKREVEHGNEEDDDDVTDTEVEVRKRREVASALGIVSDDLSSVKEISSRCCSDSYLCSTYGGICLPPRYKPFFTCSKHGLCSGGCICFLRPDNCKKCNGRCENGGTCKSKCSSLEGTVKSSICGRNCQCCINCEDMPVRGDGKCKKTCAKHEVSDGRCPKESNCMCCVDRTCGNQRCGSRGTCRMNCLRSEKNTGLKCEGIGCTCCEEIISDNTCGNQRCGLWGTCRMNCLRSETNTGFKCKGIGCTCCETIISGGPKPLPVDLAEMHR